MTTQEAEVESKEKLAASNEDCGGRRKRLSRKEQKARKRQKRRQEGDASSSKQNEENHEEVSESTKNESGSTSEPLTQAQINESYQPTLIPSLEDLKKKHGAKPLGKCFPNAVIMKSQQPPIPKTKASLVLFYQYVDPLWPESVTQQLMAYLCQIAKKRVLGGRIRVAREGVNATLSSRDYNNTTGAMTLRHFAKDLQSFHPIFAKTDFKFIDDLSGDRHFKDFKVFPVKELVFYGLNAQTAPLSKGGTHLAAQDFHAKLAEKDTVVVDVRNHYEAAIGRFDGQTTKSNDLAATENGGATYIDPKMRKSTDFATWLEKPETKDQLAGKQVLLYCTGGVRCERASAFLNHSMGDQLSGVYQLQGGIERYLKAYPDGGFWRGKNFVFDKREAFGVDNPDGDGGVVKHKKNSKKIQKEYLPEMQCCVCNKPWDRYVGKKKCSTCGVPVLMCDSCMSSQKKDKLADTLIRCPLCVQENVTVRANEVDWTNNGVTPVATASNGEGKAAPSVLKWGGGHAVDKKKRRRLQKKVCRFGASCNRPDCFFLHPKEGDKLQRPQNA